MNTSAPESSPAATRFAAARTLAATLRMVSLARAAPSVPHAIRSPSPFRRERIQRPSSPRDDR